jgi:hypothetical protein
VRRFKLIGLASIITTVLTATIGAGPASAGTGVFCSTASFPCTSKWPVATTMDFGLKSEAVSKLTDTSGSITESCDSSTIQGTLAANPDGSGTATVNITVLGWAFGPLCNVTTDVLQPGRFKVEAEGSGNGSITADARIEWTTPAFGVSCTYGVEAGTALGTLKEGTGTTATFVVNAVVKRLSGSSFVCVESKRWAAEYVLKSPSITTLYVSAS